MYRQDSNGVCYQYILNKYVRTLNNTGLHENNFIYPISLFKSSDWFFFSYLYTIIIISYY